MVEAYLSCQSHASAHEQTVAGYSCGHHAELARVDERNQVLDFLPERGIVVEVLRLVGVGGLRAGVGVAEAGHSGG